MKALRKWREERKERRLEKLAELDPAERQRLLDEQSPLKAKWGYFPK